MPKNDDASKAGRRARCERQLGALLQLAYSGELAAAYAYRGHWKSCSDPGQRAQIQQIEEEEWKHRAQVGEMLNALGLEPESLRELRARCIGRTLGFLCHVSGGLLPMYGAGKLESRNVREYEAAARHAQGCGREAWVDCLLSMAEVEWDHEAYFRSQVQSNWLGRKLSLWPVLPARASIRQTAE